jgi:hypothetical protein
MDAAYQAFVFLIPIRHRTDMIHRLFTIRIGQTVGFRKPTDFVQISTKKPSDVGRLLN